MIAIFIGYRDLAAIRAGAMLSEGRTKIRAGVLVGATTLLLLIGRVLYFLFVVRSLF